MADIKSILTNPLIAQYLSGLGADLMKYGGDTSKGFQMEETNKVTNQSIKANNMMKMIQHALGPDGTSMKADNKGITLNLTKDSAAFKNLLGGSGVDPAALALPAPAATSSFASTPAPTAATTTPASTTSTGMTNPFASMKPADLAGMDAQSIIALASLYTDRKKLENMTAAQVTDELYKKQLIEQSKAATTENTPSVDIVVGGKPMKVTPKDAIAWTKIQKESKPVSQKEFEEASINPEYAKFLDRVKPNEKEMFLRATMADPKLKAAALEMARAGATTLSLGEVVKRKEALDEVDRKDMVMKPDFITKVEKSVGKLDVWRFSNQPAIEEVKKRDPKLSDAEAAVKAHQVAILRQANSEIKQAYPDAVFNGKGWYSGKQLIRSNPYAR